jgi:hypothetical protein
MSSKAERVRRRRRRALVVVAAFASATTIAIGARGQDPKVAAEALFDEGRRLIEKDNAALACPKFAESQRLDPSPATLINLGSCYERLGRTATAWATYREAASLASYANRPSLFTIAQRHAAALEPNLVRVAIHVSSPFEGLEVRRDGIAVGAGEWDLAIPMDPGTHQVTASAPNKKSWTTTVQIGDRGKTTTVTVPALEDGPPPAAAPPTTNAIVPVTPIGGSGSAPLGVGADTSSTGSTQRTLGLVSGGLGLAGVAVGTIFVVMAKSKYDDSRDRCPSDANLCTQEGVSLRDDARAFGTGATIAYGVGAAALVGGAVLYFTAPRGEPKPTSARGVHLATSGTGVLVLGRW